MELLKFSLGYAEKQIDHIKRLTFFEFDKNDEAFNQYQNTFNTLKRFSIDLYKEDDYWNYYKILEGDSYWNGKIWVGRSIIWNNHQDRKLKILKLVEELNTIFFGSNDLDFYMRIRMILNCYDIIYGKSGIYIHGLYQEAFYKESDFNFEIKVKIPDNANFENRNHILLSCHINSNFLLKEEHKAFNILVIRRKTEDLNRFYSDNIMLPHLMIASNVKIEEAIHEVENTLNNLKAGNLLELLTKISVFTDDIKGDLYNCYMENSGLYKLAIVAADEVL